LETAAKLDVAWAKIQNLQGQVQKLTQEKNEILLFDSGYYGL